MGSSDHKCCQLIIKQVLQGDPRDLCQLDPLVVSCGGMYIPHRVKKPTGLWYHILTTSNETEPVKVVTGARPQTVLQKMWTKESMN